ncbi:DUF4340 domain-containing protein [Aliiglaciecola sp. SL4]|uniref:DUF4340 domain-containing protein n=1 Tax=Aliiglaciecola sp. SL4 TaxID=3239806 RepID=UPI00355BF44A
MNKQLVSLVVIIAALAAAIYFLTIGANQASAEKLKLFPELAEQAQKIQQIQVSNANGSLIDARQSQGQWITVLPVSEREYPLQQKALSELVDGLSKAVLFEAKTAKSENFGRLGLQDIDQVDSQGTLIKIRIGTKDYQVLVGARASLGQGSFARLIGEKQTWLLDRIINLPTDQYAWLKQPILDVLKEQVSYLRREGNAGFEIQKDFEQEDGFTLKGLGESEELKYQSILSAFVDNLVNLKFEKIVDAGESGFDPQSVTATFEVGLEDGRILNMWLWEHADAAYVRFGGDFGKYWYDVNYQLSSFSAGQIDKTYSDFIQDKRSQTQLPQEYPIDEGESPQ